MVRPSGCGLFVLGVIAGGLAWGGASCARPDRHDAAQEAHSGAAAHAPDVRADSAAPFALPLARGLGAPPPALSQVRIAPARGLPPPALPAAEPAAPSAPSAGAAGSDGLATDDALRPPIPRTTAPLSIAGPRRGWVELDVRVDENGEVTYALPVAGEGRETADPRAPITHAAIEAALRTRYYPAVQAGRAVAVWCRRRVEVRPR